MATPIEPASSSSQETYQVLLFIQSDARIFDLDDDDDDDECAIVHLMWPPIGICDVMCIGICDIEAEGQKGWLAIATLKPTFTFLGRDFAIFNTFTWQIPTKKVKVGFRVVIASQPFCFCCFAE